MNLVELDPDGKIAEHDETDREQEEVFIVLEGTAAILIDREEYPAPAGAFARLDPSPAGPS
jgi:quercetin dioxygenase-like cupin family protein